MSARIVRMTAPLGKAILEKGIFCHPETDLPIKSEPAAAPKKRTASRRVNGLARKPCNSFTTILPCQAAFYSNAYTRFVSEHGFRAVKAKNRPGFSRCKTSGD